MEVGITKHRLNVEGRYYTSDDCDGCAYCASVAPENFDFDKDINAYYVSRQPATAGEEELVSEAMEDCPISAIHQNVDHGRERVNAELREV